MPAFSDLSSPNWRERKRAIQALAHSGDPGLVHALLDILRAGHTDLNALNAALQILDELGEQVSPALVELLDDADAGTRLYAALALGSLCDERSIPALIEALGDQDPNVRFQAIDALGNLRAKAAVPYLLEIARSDDFYLAFTAVSALGEIGDVQALPDLLPLLSHETLANAAAPALGKLGDARFLAPLAGWLRSPAGDVHSAALALANYLEAATGEQAPAQVLDHFTAVDLSRLIDALPERPRLSEHSAAEDNPSPAQPSDISTALACILSRLAGYLDRERPADPVLRDILAGGLIKLLRHSAARPLALSALGKLRSFPLEGLAPLLDDEDLVARRAAVALLSQKAGPAELALLLSALQGEDEDIASQAASGLGRMKAPQSFALLLDALAHGGPGLRLAALEALFSLEHPGFPAAMLDLLQSPEAGLRQAGLHGLRLALERAAEHGEPPDPTLVEAVLAAGKDAVPAVRRMAVEALGFCGGPEVEAVLAGEVSSVDAGQRAAAARALGHGPAGFALPLLHTLLQDHDPWVRIPALRSLARLGGSSSLAALEGLVNDAAPPVRLALVQAAVNLESGAGGAGGASGAGGAGGASGAGGAGTAADRILKALILDPDPDVRQAVKTARGACQE